MNTNYNNQKNRCEICGHRKVMHGIYWMDGVKVNYRNGCRVVNGFMEAGLRIDRPCRCRESHG